MLILSPYFLVLLNIFGLVLTNPVQQILSNDKSEHTSLDQAFRQAEKILNRYYYLIDSDTDHLVHGMLHMLMNNPTSFPFIPHQAMTIAFKNVAQKLGHDEVDALTKPLLLTIEKNYQTKSKQPSSFTLTDETKEKIEDALDKFLDEAEFNPHL
jgi:hypothetical protein